jgi:hypothetical protein
LSAERTIGGGQTDLRDSIEDPQPPEAVADLERPTELVTSALARAEISRTLHRAGNDSAAVRHAVAEALKDVHTVGARGSGHRRRTDRVLAALALIPRKDLSAAPRTRRWEPNDCRALPRSKDDAQFARGGCAMGLAEVSDILWRERELLDVLLFKLEEEQLLLAAGKVRWLARATREVELVLEQIRLTELTRSIEVDAVAASLGLDPNPSLSSLADAAPAPWSDLFRSHRTAFLTLTQEISSLAEANRDFVSNAYRSAQETLRAIGAVQVDGYTAAGKREGSIPRRRLLDEAI